MEFMPAEPEFSMNEELLQSVMANVLTMYTKLSDEKVSVVSIPGMEPSIQIGDKVSPVLSAEMGLRTGRYFALVDKPASWKLKRFEVALSAMRVSVKDNLLYWQVTTEVGGVAINVPKTERGILEWCDLCLKGVHRTFKVPGVTLYNSAPANLIIRGKEYETLAEFHTEARALAYSESSKRSLEDMVQILGALHESEMACFVQIWRGLNCQEN